MNRIIKDNYILVFLGAILLTPGWYEWGSGIFLLVAFIPFFLITENLINEPKGVRRVYLLASLMLLIWNVSTTYWIKNATFAGALTAFFLTTFLMSIPVWLSLKVRKLWGQRAFLFAFVVFWISYEFAYMHGEISWPWLTLGHGFMYEVKLIQWYEYTGVFGGSLWVLVANVLLFKAFFSNENSFKLNRSYLSAAILFILIPIIFSVIRFATYKEIDNPRKIVVVQPNMDPYHKFNDTPPIEHARVQINEGMRLTDSTVDFIVTPETSLLGNFWIGEMNKAEEVKLIRDSIKHYPDCSYIVGIVCRKLFCPGDSLSSTAQVLNDQGYYFDYYNSAILIDTSENIQIYHKSQLVTGIEKMPYARQLHFLEKLMVNLGGTFRSNATQKERAVFSSLHDSLLVGPVICWESVFGEYVTDYVKLGANYLFVITNDGWWGNTPGHRQHNALSSIRAIENRRSIARSANTGISSFINQRGEVLQSLGWWKRGALVDELNANDKLTFYTLHGDYIGRVAFFSGVFLLLYMISSYLISLKNKLTGKK